MAVFAVWFGFLFIVSAVTLRKRFPRPDTVRLARIVLTPDGCYDITPEKQTFLAWSAVTDLRRNETGLFWFLAKNIAYIPKGGVEGGAQSEDELYQVAHTLWKSGGSEWPREVPPVLPNLGMGA